MRKLLPILFAISAVFHLVISSGTGEKPVLISSFTSSATTSSPISSSSLSSSSLGLSSVAVSAPSSLYDEKNKIQRKYDELVGLKDISKKLEFLISMINEGDKVQSTDVILMVFIGRNCYEGWTVPILAQKRYHIIFKMLLADTSEAADKLSYEYYFDDFKTSAFAELCKRNRLDLIAPFLKIVFWKFRFVVNQDYRDYLIGRLFQRSHWFLYKERRDDVEILGIAFISYLMSRPEVSSWFVADKLKDPQFAFQAKIMILRYVCKEDLELAIKGTKNLELINVFQKILTNLAAFIPLNREAAIYYYFYSDLIEHNERLKQLMPVLMERLLSEVSKIVADYIGVSYKFGEAVSTCLPLETMLTEDDLTALS